MRAAGPRAADVPPAQVRLTVRDQAERLWPISAERPIVGKGGPLKSVLRRLMRWYVEPAFADQRAFNDAVLKLIDDLDERHRSRLEPAEAVRIAVCAPQVPFVRGGAELMADDLVAALRARGHEAELVTRAVQVVSGHARARPGVPLAAARPRPRPTGGRSTA